MQELGIQIICANTPQAKGRVERANKTLQDRLTKELRLCGISTPEQANRWLPEFMEDYNRRFAIPPRSQINAHRPLTSSDNLDLILCRKSQRILSKNLTIQYHKTIFQIRVDRPSYAMQKAPVTVLENALGEITILYHNKPLVFEVYNQQAKQAEVVPSKSVDFELRKIPKPYKPAPDHPWRKPWSNKNAPQKGDILLCQTRGHFNFGLTANHFVLLFTNKNFRVKNKRTTFNVRNMRLKVILMQTATIYIFTILVSVFDLFACL